MKTLTFFLSVFTVHLLCAEVLCKNSEECGIDYFHAEQYPSNFDIVGKYDAFIDTLKSWEIESTNTLQCCFFRCENWDYSLSVAHSLMKTVQQKCGVTFSQTQETLVCKGNRFPHATFVSSEYFGKRISFELFEKHKTKNANDYKFRFLGIIKIDCGAASRTENPAQVCTDF